MHLLHCRSAAVHDLAVPPRVFDGIRRGAFPSLLKWGQRLHHVLPILLDLAALPGAHRSSRRRARTPAAAHGRTPPQFLVPAGVPLRGVLVTVGSRSKGPRALRGLSRCLAGPASQALTSSSHAGEPSGPAHLHLARASRSGLLSPQPTSASDLAQEP